MEHGACLLCGPEHRGLRQLKDGHLLSHLRGASYSSPHLTLQILTGRYSDLYFENKETEAQRLSGCQSYEQRATLTSIYPITNQPTFYGITSPSGFPEGSSFPKYFLTLHCFLLLSFFLNKNNKRKRRLKGRRRLRIFCTFTKY